MLNVSGKDMSINVPIRRYDLFKKQINKLIINYFQLSLYLRARIPLLFDCNCLPVSLCVYSDSLSCQKASFDAF